MIRKNKNQASGGNASGKQDGSLGAYLRRERELRFIELEEIAKSTMISLRFLEALENDDFEDLPHDTFVRGFLRSYAKYVGLDQDEVITNYEHFVCSGETKEVVEEPISTDAPLENKKLMIWGGGAIALCLVILLIYLGTSGDEQSPPADGTSTPEVVPMVRPLSEEIPEFQESVPPVEKAVEELPVAPVNKPPEKAVVEPEKEPSVLLEKKQTLEKTAPAQVIPEAKPTAPKITSVVAQEKTKGVELSIKAVEKSWILYQLDGVETDIILEEGGIKKLKARDKIVLTVGNAAGVELSLDGEPLPPLGKAGQVVKGLVFKAKAGQKGENETIQKKKEEQ